MILRHFVFAALVVGAAPALADRPPPANALPLSEIIAALEARHDIHFIDEIEWDDDGYWEAEFYTNDGGKVEIKLDPVTGAPRR